MSDQNINPSIEDEISLKDIVDFLIESWKTILATGIVGILGAVGYLIVTPNQYEATAQIQGAQITLSNPAAPTNIEDPNTLIARMKLPSSYDKNGIAACGLDNSKYPQETLANMVKLSIIKGTSLVELKVTSLNQAIAIKCSQALVDQIKDYQTQLANIFIVEARGKLASYQKRLLETQAFINKADKSSSPISAAYLASRDEIKIIADEIIRLNDLISSANSRQTKLVSPIYAPDFKVSPKHMNALIAGLFAGLFLGLLLTLGKCCYRAYKVSNPSNV
jgi:LPS O-antigen subunit length determinant protein (WzzB/FepE family)